jgi:voltage-gated potassium channel
MQQLWWEVLGTRSFGESVFCRITGHHELTSTSETAMIPSARNSSDLTPYQFFMLCLCLWALLILGAGSFLKLSESTEQILLYADYAVCLLFFADFLHSLYAAPNKLRYMASWGWIDLLSSIPIVDSLRWGRAARVMRILRVMRGVKSARAIAHFLSCRRAESALLAALLLSLLIIVLASIAILQFEVPARGNIVTAEDALWWAISTMTTAPYGDAYPITPEGRLVAVFLMAAGVGVFGILAGLIASWFLSPAAEEADSDLRDIKALLLEMRGDMGRHESGVRARV